MAFIRAVAPSGGGTYSETVLWENSNPTANFPPQSVSLSDSIDNYDFIKVTARRYLTDATYLGGSLMSIEDFKNTASNGNWFLAPCVSTNGSRRNVYYESSTSVYIGAPGGGSTWGWIIPLQVIGVKI